MKDLYSVLGVAKDSDQAAIKKAFKTLARKWHPDVNKTPEAEARFKEISAAYEVLGDEQRRQNYDEFGEASLQSGFDADKARAWRNMGGGRAPGGGVDGFPGFAGGGSFEDILESLFARGGARPNASAKGPDLESTVRVSFMDAVRGGEVQIGIARPAHCGTCNGEGGTGRQTCAACGGRGRRRVGAGGVGIAVACDECGGSGVTWKEECGTCGGTGRVRERKDLNVRVPAGVAEGQVLRLRGQGGEGRGGGPAGDLLLTLDIADHPFLRRKGKDLEMDVPVRLAEALAGGTIEVPTPTSRVRVKVPPGTSSGRRLRVAGHGIQEREGPGDLYLVLRPTLPEHATDEAIDLARRLDALADTDPRAHLTL